MSRRLGLAGALLLAAAPWHPALAAAPEAIARGEYLTRAADCAACHTVAGGEPYAGGRAFVLPFGTIYSPNITPDAQTGVANYTDDEWVGALRRGVGRGGRHLYPAMPYANYALLTRDDALAIRAYLAAVPAVHQPNRDNTLGFPFNQRWTLVFWNLLNAPDRSFVPDASRSAAYNRGAWLVEGPGHCAQCHTPRSLTYGLSGRHFAGAVQNGWLAYNLTSDKTHGLGGWSDADLAAYLSTGTAAGHGTASGQMAEVVGNSLRYLTPPDIAAMVTYLRGVAPLPDGPSEQTLGQTSEAELPPRGARIFAEACAGCHLPGGDGRQSPYAALAGVHALRDPTGQNLLAVLAQGSELQTSHAGVQFMHAFTGTFTDTELADTAVWLEGSLGGTTASITPADVAKARHVAAIQAPP